jgi:hypothetical protein
MCPDMHSTRRPGFPSRTSQFPRSGIPRPEPELCTVGLDIGDETADSRANQRTDSLGISTRSMDMLMQP